MNMDDNYMMAENMRQGYEENPSLHREITILRKKLDITTKKLEMAMDMLEFIFEAGSDRSHPEEWVEFVFQNTSATLDDIEKIK